jgi:hypothetical protein
MSQQDKIVQRRKESTPLESKSSGPFLARVVSNVDADYLGAVWVELLHEGSGNEPVVWNATYAKFTTPYWSNTDKKHNGNSNTFVDTQKSNGLWIPAPDVGVQGLVILVEGNIKNAYWIATIPDRYKNFSVPGIPATTANTKSQGDRLPVGELNPNTTQPGKPATDSLKPVHTLADIFKIQGLLKDDTRGITSSGARRETPSRVFGISTAGPLDEQSPKKNVGTPDAQQMAYVNRLGGSQFVMDDGDNKYSRKTPATIVDPETGEVTPGGPPEYTKIGGTNIPHNELVRIRTRTGHQILLHNSEDLIYIGNANGTTWIELTGNGKIDIFAQDSISIHTKNDLNIRADRDLNLEAGRNVNIKAAGVYPGDKTNNGKIHLESLKDFEIISNADTKITTIGNLYLSTTGNHIEQAKKIHMNGPDALKVTPLITYFNPTEKEGTTLESILLRVPSHEPWPLHEHLNPEDFVPKKTDITTGTAATPPGKWTLYTSPDDTFKQNKG